ncbi:MAG: caspase family protein [Desulfobacterales bacterium]|nr:MAG: caspase family protein [Desulfobacterales bacterium]
MRVFALQLLCVCLITLFLPFGKVNAQAREYFLTRPDTHKYAVIFGGAAAGETYEQRFRQWSLKLYESLAGDYGYPPDHITLLLGRGDPEETRIAGACRLETILEAMDALRKKVRPGDQLLFLFVGHGTSDDQEAKFVIVGPDLTGAKFAEILRAFSEQDIIVVNTTSSSQPFCNALSAPGRVIVCATRSAAERYDTIFPQFLLEALENRAADRDKNRRVSAFEAFYYAREKVNRWYTDQDRLPSEHPTLDDSGDGLFDTDPEPGKDDGRLAQIAYVDPLSAFLPDAIAAGPGSDTLRELTAKAQVLERSVMLLRNQKAEVSAKDYWQQMEPLLIELARTNRRLKTLQAALEKWRWGK